MSNKKSFRVCVIWLVKDYLSFDMEMIKILISNNS